MALRTSMEMRSDVLGPVFPVREFSYDYVGGLVVA